MGVSVPIAIVGYDPRWLFAREAATIRTLLGNRSFVSSMWARPLWPELATKPVIEVLLEIAESADEAAHASALEGGRHVLRIREPN
ncbi:MAG TPA: hypothetical protein VJ756_21680 [Terriglobales bacterium]|nr:hypothetical protein [Terriglobales bacterium]